MCITFRCSQLRDIQGGSRRAHGSSRRPSAEGATWTLRSSSRSSARRRAMGSPFQLFVGSLRRIVFVTRRRARRIVGEVGTAFTGVTGQQGRTPQASSSQHRLPRSRRSPPHRRNRRRHRSHTVGSRPRSSRRLRSRKTMASRAAPQRVEGLPSVSHRLWKVCEKPCVFFFFPPSFSTFFRLFMRAPTRGPSSQANR